MKEKWTEKNIPDLKGKVFIVTGANSGIGYWTSYFLAEKNATLVMTGRNEIKLVRGAKEIEAAFPGNKIHTKLLDLADLKSVKSFSRSFIKEFKSLHCLINNAGVMALPYMETIDGFEMQIGTNHLGHFVLTAELFPLLKKTPKSRVVNVSSMAHTRGTMNFKDLMGKNRYSKWGAYSQSKLANLLFTYELQRRLQKANIDCTAYGTHPGFSATKLLYGGAEIEKKKGQKLFMKILASLFAQSSKIGCLSTLMAATDLAVVPGGFYGPKRMRGYPRKVTSIPESHSEESAIKLWKISEELTGTNFIIE